jgi:multiple sugar transport system ATP-binding protein
MASVRLEEVRKVYGGAGGTVAVEEATFGVGEGEFVVLVGPSGCGKSTLLRMIAGLETVTAGRVFIGDREVSEVPAQDRDIAMVFQSYALYPHMTVAQNLSFGLRLRKTPRAEIERRVRAAAEILGIEELLERRPRQLSGGQRQRVALGRAIVRDPRVFLFDEPLSNLDAKLRVQMRAELAALHRRLGATMIYVTHDQVEAMTLGDRIVVLDRGRIQQIAAPLDLYDRPANRFVAGFMGSPAMNFVDGVLAREDGLVFRADHDAFTCPLPAHWTRALGPRAGHRVTLGVRPEHVLALPPAGDDEAAAVAGSSAAAVRFAPVPVAFEALEPLGNEIFIHATANGHRLTARVAPQRLAAPGESATLYFDLARVHFFDGETLESIPAGSA